MSENNQNHNNTNQNGNGNSGSNGKHKSNKNNGFQKKNGQTQPKGAIPELKDNVYVVGNDYQSDKNQKTTEALLNYILMKGSARARDVVKSIKDNRIVTYPLPDELAADATDSQKMIYKIQATKATNKVDELELGLHQAYGFMIGQCTKQVLNRLQSRQDWREIESDTDALKLHQAIKEIGQDFQDHIKPEVSISEVLKTAFTIHQGEKESITDYYKRFKNVHDVRGTLYGRFGMEALVERRQEDLNLNGAVGDQRSALRDTASDAMVAILYLSSTRKGPALMQDLKNWYAMGEDKYPVTLEAAHDLLTT